MSYGYQIVGGQPQYIAGNEGGYQDLYGNSPLDGSVMGGYDVIGAQPPPPQQNRRVVMREQFSQERGLVLPFGRATVTASTSSEFTANPQVVFRPATIIIAATALTGLTVDDCRVGKNSMFASAGAVPASMFGADSTFRGLKFDTATPGIQIVIQVTDVSGSDNVVAIAMSGVAAE